MSSQLSPLGTCLHSHGPATPALRQPPADSGTLGMDTGSTGTPCLRAGHLGSQILGTPRRAPGDTVTRWVGGCQASTYLCFRTSPARSSPVLQEWMGQENWSPGEGQAVSGCHHSPLPVRVVTLGPTLASTVPQRRAALTIEAVQVEGHAGLLPVRRPLQQRGREGAGGRSAQLGAGHGVHQLALAHRLVASEGIVGHKPVGKGRCCRRDMGRIMCARLGQGTTEGLRASLEGSWQHPGHMCQAGPKHLGGTSEHL